MKKIIKNEEIHAEKVFLISEGGVPIGETPVSEAVARAQDAGLDLIRVSGAKEVPVCRIMDAGKYAYEQKKREKGGKKPAQGVREIRISPGIGEHDLDVKLKKAEELLGKGSDVKIALMLHGREKGLKDYYKPELINAIEKVENGTVKKTGRGPQGDYAVLSPKKK